eukprot:scaffold29381_cov16-Tisochrysis_lutea.AAC.2
MELGLRKIIIANIGEIHIILTEGCLKAIDTYDLEAGASSNPPDPHNLEGPTAFEPICLLSVASLGRVAQFLINRGANLNAQGKSRLPGKSVLLAWSIYMQHEAAFALPTKVHVKVDANKLGVYSVVCTCSGCGVIGRAAGAAACGK